MSFFLIGLTLVVAGLISLSLVVVYVCRHDDGKERQAASILQDKVSLPRPDEAELPVEETPSAATLPAGTVDHRILRVDDMQIGDTFHLKTVNGSNLVVTLINREDGVFTLRYTPTKHHRNKPLRDVRAALISSIRPEGFHVRALVPGCQTVWIRLVDNLGITTSPIVRIFKDIPQAA